MYKSFADLETNEIKIRCLCNLYSALPNSHKLCERFRKPLVSTSANVSGEPSPGNFSEVSDIIKNGVDYVVKYRQDDTSKAKPSNIIKLGDGGVIQVIR